MSKSRAGFKPARFSELADKTDITIFVGTYAWQAAELFEINRATPEIAIASGADPLASIDGVHADRPLVVIPSALHRDTPPILASKQTTAVDIERHGDLSTAEERRLLEIIIQQAADDVVITLHGERWPMVDIMREVAQAEPKPAQPDIWQEPETSEPDEVRNPGTVAAILQNTAIGRYAVQVADYVQMPRDTAVLTALSVVSAAVSMCYSVGFRHTGATPTGIYVVVEQPPASGKSFVLSSFSKPIGLAIGEMNKLAHKVNSQAGKDDLRVPYYRAFLSDVTPEALEVMLIDQGGHFCLASAEQALVNTALGVSYGGPDKKSNNDLILKGHNGEWHGGGRTKRASFQGDVFGSVTAIAQPGTIDTILEQSNGTGLAERFIFHSEPPLLGVRDHINAPQPPDAALEQCYSNACATLVKQYEHSRTNGCIPPVFDQMRRLHIAASDWDLIQQRKQIIEPTMADGGRYSHNLLRGCAGKYDQRVMKVAGSLHAIEHLMAGHPVPDIIDPKFVAAAMAITDLSLEQLYQAMVAKGLIGMSAEQEAIHRIVGKRESRGMLWSELYNAAKGVQPFKSYPGKGLAARVKGVCRVMVDAGLLAVGETMQGGRDVNKFYVL